MHVNVGLIGPWGNQMRLKRFGAWRSSHVGEAALIGPLGLVRNTPPRAVATSPHHFKLRRTTIAETASKPLSPHPPPYSPPPPDPTITMRVVAAPTDALLGLLALFLLPAAASAASLTLYLPAKPNPFSLPSTTHATLSTLGSQYSAPLTASNSFVFHNVTPGSYLADVHCQTDAYHPLRIDVADTGVQAWETFRGNDWANKGEAVPAREGSGGRGVEVRALGGKSYFMERPTFSVFTILKNPMILMGLVSMGIFIGMPYLMENMDPELRAEFENHQKQSPMNAVMSGGQGGGDNPLGNFDMAAYLAGSGKKDSGSGSGSGSSGKGQGGKR
ncbi:hypothetical protein EDB81DRAFT_790371 [Dactylonectria macrodidyma]|uniref:ER membrane protein complex subunit 7 beta-sandwich domain-containing protein n=1 Tax=Dactylonectria macrodidyma TaxID=307937 RepID=A0A9P9F563_9HYPO|nr:hypothetical protein EDB81DRAFT_790371 [Dactylonectria macrodidyma]